MSCLILPCGSLWFSEFHCIRTEWIKPFDLWVERLISDYDRHSWQSHISLTKKWSKVCMVLPFTVFLQHSKCRESILCCRNVVQDFAPLFQVLGCILFLLIVSWTKITKRPRFHLVTFLSSCDSCGICNICYCQYVFQQFSLFPTIHNEWHDLPRPLSESLTRQSTYDSLNWNFRFWSYQLSHRLTVTVSSWHLNLVVLWDT